MTPKIFMFLSNISNNCVLPEIDNINELDNEEKNPIDYESIRVEITNSLLKKSKKETIYQESRTFRNA